MHMAADTILIRSSLSFWNGLPSLNLDMSIEANMGFCLKSKSKLANSVDPSETTRNDGSWQAVSSGSTLFAQVSVFGLPC